MAIPAQAKQLLDFIASKEAPRGYDTVYGNNQASMPRPVTAMTIDGLIADGPRRYQRYGSSAAGRYQFMPNTLKALRQQLKLTGAERMTPDFQDRLGYQLLLNRGWAKFLTGVLSVTAFGKAIAQEWASFPVLAATQGQHRTVQRGESYYAGDRQNKSLVGAAEVEAALRAILREPKLLAPTISPVPIALPSVAAVVPAPTAAEAKAELPWWQRIFARKTKTPEPGRPGLKPGGSALLYDVQVKLRDRAYYTRMPPDGLDGPFTKAAVSQSRADNGLPDGGIDTAFMAALDAMPNRSVPTEKANATLSQAAQARPDLFNPSKWLATAGATLLTGGAVDGSGLLDTIQTATASVNDVAGRVQTSFDVIASAVHFVVEHRTWLLVGLGLFCVLKAVRYALGILIDFRRALF